jgi:predicted unusual protein kinase regulating ubiquinone biosynthesis (AarF/ABC1/UbiB family)
VVYKVDRLTRSLADFAKLVELFDKQNVSFVSVTRLSRELFQMSREFWRRSRDSCCKLQKSFLTANSTQRPTSRKALISRSRNDALMF